MQLIMFHKRNKNWEIKTFTINSLHVSNELIVVDLKFRFYDTPEFKPGRDY